MYTPSDRVQQQLERSYRHHPPSGNQVERYQRIRSLAGQLAHHIATNTPSSREQAAALTKLDEVVMWANAAIARNEVWEGERMLEPLQLSFGN